MTHRGEDTEDTWGRRKADDVINFTCFVLSVWLESGVGEDSFMEGA